MLIASIKYSKDKHTTDCQYALSHNKTTITINEDLIKEFHSLRIEFDCDIALIRHHDYKWINSNQPSLSNWYSPKILKLTNGVYIQANTPKGIWQYSPKEKHVLLWHFNVEFSKPLTHYSGHHNAKQIVQSAFLQFKAPLELLMSKKGAVEFSRSKIPFKAIACFTDHCDFDTEENLVLQREFFEKYNIKTTKGFFINDFSNRPNASFQTNAEELMKWKNDGHELAYHSLSQSIKDVEVSFMDFETFNPPTKDIPTWIDHGYQPYNFSLYKKHGRKDDWYEEQLKDKSIAILWNYIDSGTATKGVINQINPEHFTLKKYVKGIKSNTPKIRYAALIKNIMFHFYNSEKYALNYKDIAKFYKLTFMAKKPKYIFNLLGALGLVAGAILKIFLTWNSSKIKTYPLARYTPVFFKHKIKDEEFSIFQTIEMVDFKKGLCKENIDLLIEESGLFIAHTYFSVPMGYHTGKLLRTPSQIDEDVEANFSYLADKIANNEVWNPTLKQLISYFDNIENAVFSIDSSDNIYLASQDAIPIREIN